MLEDGYQVDPNRGVLVRKGLIAKAWEEEIKAHRDASLLSLLVTVGALCVGALWFILWQTVGWIAAGFAAD
jgi:hypothetical protein